MDINEEAEKWLEKGNIEFSANNYEEAIKCYEKAVQIKPDYADAFYNWGIALSDFAEIKLEKALFREAFYKFHKAVEIKPDDDAALCSCGNALLSLAQIKKDKSLFPEIVSYYKKTKNDILDIFVSLKEVEKCKYIVDEKMLCSLLDTDCSDGLFFKEATKNISEKAESIEKCKDAYIRSFFIISQLHVNHPYEKSVAHYTKKAVTGKMMFEDSYFRLNAINYSNDLAEGKVLFNYMFGDKKYPTNEAVNEKYHPFAGCFMFNPDSLNQFRL